MSQFLSTLGGLALGGCAGILLLALAGRSTRTRWAAQWRCWLWLLLCLRLAVPLPLLPQRPDSAPIQVPLPPAVTAPARPVSPPAPAGQPANPSPPEDKPAPSVPDTPPVQEPEGKPAFRPSPAQALFSVWILGAVGVLGWNLLAHARFLAYLRRWADPADSPEIIQPFNRAGDLLSLNRRPRLLLCQGLKTPMLAGLFRPAVLLPPEPARPGELACTLLHELTHFKRRDIWLKTLALWVKALYWFNPLSWIMYRLIERDTELACDEEALGLLPPELHPVYGQAILSAAARLNAPPSLSPRSR